jgi:ABC-type enterochelin transport system permease subunit
MSPWLVGDLFLVGLGLPVAIWIGARGNGVDRLIGLELAAVNGTLALMAFAQAVSQPSYLIVPTVAVVMGLVGVLVFTRLLAVRS